MKTFRLIFSFLLLPLSLSLAHQSSEREFRILVLSDLHFSSDETKRARLQEVIQNINDGKDGQVDLVVITGDVVASILGHTNDAPENSRINQVLNILSELKVPYIIGLGNHDYRQDKNSDSTWSQTIFSKKQVLNIESQWKEAGIPAYLVSNLKSWRIFMLNSMHGIASKEHFGADQLAWFESELKKTKGPIILTFHHPIEITSGGFWPPFHLPGTSKDASFWGDGPITINTDPAFFQLLEKYRNQIKLILVGHGHQFKSGTLLNIPVQETASLGEPQYAYGLPTSIGFKRCPRPHLIVEGNLRQIIKIKERCR